jgi:hypothetical protein
MLTSMALYGTLFIDNFVTITVQQFEIDISGHPKIAA